MAIVAHYIWQRKETPRGYGWVPWKEAQLPTGEQDEATGHWAVLDTDGSQLCLCVDRQGAERVAKRLRRALVGWGRLPDYATLHRTKAGWVVHHHQSAEDFGETFATREEAEAYILGEPHASTLPALLTVEKPLQKARRGHQSPEEE